MTHISPSLNDKNAQQPNPERTRTQKLIEDLKSWFQAEPVSAKTVAQKPIFLCRDLGAGFENTDQPPAPGAANEYHEIFHEKLSQDITEVYGGKLTPVSFRYSVAELCDMIGLPQKFSGAWVHKNIIPSRDEHFTPSQIRRMKTVVALVKCGLTPSAAQFMAHNTPTRAGEIIDIISGLSISRACKMCALPGSELYK